MLVSWWIVAVLPSGRKPSKLHDVAEPNQNAIPTKEMSRSHGDQVQTIIKILFSLG